MPDSATEQFREQWAAVQHDAQHSIEEEQDHGDHDVPEDLLAIYAACEDAGTSADDFRAAFGGED